MVQLSTPILMTDGKSPGRSNNIATPNEQKYTTLIINEETSQVGDLNPLSMAAPPTALGSFLLIRAARNWK